MLKNAIKHNRKALEKIKMILEIYREFIKNDIKYVKEIEVDKIVLDDFHFYIDNDTVSCHTGYWKGKSIQGLFTDVVRVNASSKDKYVMSLIDELNESYDTIKSCGK